MNHFELLHKTVLTVRQPCLYLIHFLKKRFHAQHYLGSTYELQQRLTAHATGTGARLTQVLWEAYEDWQLAAIYVPRTPALDIRQLEARAKKRHSSVDYCPLCRRHHIAPRGTIQYPTPEITATLLRKD